MAGFRQELEATECICRSLPSQQVISDGKGNLHRTAAPKPEGHFPERNLASKVSPLLSSKPFPHAESELNQRKAKQTHFMCQLQIELLAAILPPWEKSWTRSSSRAEQCPCSSLSFGSFQSTKFHPICPFLLHILLSCGFEALSLLLQMGKEPQTSLQNEIVQLVPVWSDWLGLNQFSFVSSFFCRIDICMPFLGTFSALLMDSDPGRAQAPGLQEPLSLSPQHFCIQAPI